MPPNKDPENSDSATILSLQLTLFLKHIQLFNQSSYHKMETNLSTQINTLSSHIVTFHSALKTSKIEPQNKFDELQHLTTQNEACSSMRLDRIC